MTMIVPEESTIEWKNQVFCFDLIPCVLWTALPDGNFDYLNAAWQQTTGMKDVEPNIETWLKSLHKEDRLGFQAEWRKSVENRQTFHFEFRLWSLPENNYRWHKGRGQPLHDATGAILRWIGVCVDIHDQKMTQISHRASEERLRAVIDTLPVGIVLLDQNSQPVHWNSKCSELRGKEPDLVQWMQAIHPEDRQRVIASWNQSVKYREQWADVYRLVRPDGRIVWVSGRARPIMSGSEHLGFVRTLEDITALKSTEERLLNANRELQSNSEQLENEVRVRTEKAREAMAELDKLAYSIVHDMRAPLRTIVGFSRMLLEDSSEKLDEGEKDLLRRIAAAGDRQDRLIQDVLAYQSYVRNEFPVVPVNLDTLVAGILDTYAHLQQPKVQIEVHRPLGWVSANEALLTQCVSALLNNAAKFVAPGVKPHIVICAERTPGFVKLWVEDNGIGIEPAHHQRIFSIFETLNRPELYPGTGIGLPLAKKAMEKMRGNIGLESETGKGSKFWLLLPDARQFAP